MFMQAFKQAFGVLAKKPMRLWGLSILSSFICLIATIVATPFPVIGLAFNYVINAGVAKVYLDGLDGKQVYSDQLFEGTKKFFRVAGGMAWKDLWIAIWSVALLAGSIIIGVIIGLLFSFVPILSGILMIIVILICSVISAIIMANRTYSYAFVPYILMTQPEVNATEALRISAKETKGKVLQMWLADFVCSFCAVLAGIILFFLMLATLRIPVVNVIFVIIFLVYILLLLIFLPIFKGLYMAAFYKLPKPAPTQNNMYNQFGNMANQFQQYQQQPQYQQPAQPQYQQPQYQQPAQPQYQQPQYQQPAQPTQYQQPQQPQQYQNPQN